MPDTAASAPFLSIVIPTTGRDILLRTLQSLIAAEGFSSLEVIIAGHIPPGPVATSLRDLLHIHPNLQHLDIRFETGDSSRKKNAGAEAAAAPLIAFLDDDVIVAPDWPRRATEMFFLDPKLGLASGPGLVPNDINLPARLAGLALSSRAAGYVSDRYRQTRPAPYPVNWDHIIGCNAVYRREAFRQMGGFPPDFYPGEEMIAAYRTERAGWALMFLPNARVWHYPRTSWSRFARQMWSYGATRIRLLRGGVTFNLLPLIPGLWVAATLGLSLLAPFFTTAAYLLLADLALYLLLLLLITLETLLRTRKLYVLVLPLMILWMHTAYGLAEWAEFLRPGRDFSTPPAGNPAPPANP